MKTVVVGEDGSPSVTEAPVPKLGRGEALIKPRAVGICGSDLIGWYVRKKAGTVLGHEVAGEIVEVGEGVEGFAAGERVVPHHHAACLECPACARGRFVHCRQWRSSRLDPGGMAEYVRIPAGNLARDTGKIPAGLSDEEASFTEPLATVLKAFRRGRFHHDDRLLVVGLGPAGHLAIRYAKLLGANGIAGADRAASRLALAPASGAQALIDVSRETIADGARRITGGKGFDFVFVCPGKSDVILEALGTVSPGGTLVLFTMPQPDDRLAIDACDLYFREAQIVPSYSCGPVEMGLALTMLSQGRVKVADLVTHRFPIDRAPEAFQRAKEPEGSMKVVITFP